MVAKRGNESFIIVYNGELYNTQEIRAELKARGHNFRGHSDTEALLLAFLEWGPGCLQRLNGIFAFAIWDEQKRRLFMARDRLGVKPLFYAEREGCFLFGSELKALLANPLVKPVVKREGLAEILVMAPSRTPGHGVFEGISELKPGCFLWFEENGSIQENIYWQLQSREHTHNFSETVTRVRELVVDAVKRQLMADVPVATFLSGGLDSSGLTAIAADSFTKLRTYSVDYTENELYFRQSDFQPHSDAAWIRLASDRIGTEHSNIILNMPDLAGALGQATSARDLPGMADVDSSLLLFCREVKKEVTVVLSGECADEIFGGYPWFTRHGDLNSPSFPWIRNVEYKMKLFKPWLGELLKPQNYLAERYRQALAEVPRLSGENTTDEKIREMFYLNITRFMPTLLDRKDRMSMAVGLEVRVPYCDHRLVEYAWNIPWSMKHHQGREKAILRLALEGLLPKEILTRKKSPFPKTHHPAYLAIVRKELMEILENKSEPLNSLVDTKAVRAVVLSAEYENSLPWFGQLMAGPQLLAFFLQLNQWLKIYQVKLEI